MNMSILTETRHQDKFIVVLETTDNKGNLRQRSQLEMFYDNQQAVDYIKKTFKVDSPNQKIVLEWEDADGNLKQTWTILEYGQKKRYSVRLYYSTCVAVEVESEDEETAIEDAYNKIENEGADFLANLVPNDSEPDVEEI